MDSCAFYYCCFSRTGPPPGPPTDPPETFCWQLEVRNVESPPYFKNLGIILCVHFHELCLWSINWRIRPVLNFTGWTSHPGKSGGEGGRIIMQVEGSSPVTFHCCICSWNRRVAILMPAMVIAKENNCFPLPDRDDPWPLTHCIDSSVSRCFKLE